MWYSLDAEIVAALLLMAINPTSSSSSSSSSSFSSSSFLLILLHLLLLLLLLPISCFLPKIPVVQKKECPQSIPSILRPLTERWWDLFSPRRDLLVLTEGTTGSGRRQQRTQRYHARPNAWVLTTAIRGPWERRSRWEDPKVAKCRKIDLPPPK